MPLPWSRDDKSYGKNRSLYTLFSLGFRIVGSRETPAGSNVELHVCSVLKSIVLSFLFLNLSDIVHISCLLECVEVAHPVSSSSAQFLMK